MSKNAFQSLTCNLLPKKARFDTLEGKKYTVVPMVMLTEGVHKGTNGKLYYPPEEIGKTPESWDHKPVVVYHPQRNGMGISACSPTVLNTRKVGLIMNTKFRKGRLTAEAWIDMEKAKLVDNRVVEAIDKEEPMELSTGVYTDADVTPGKWGNEEYDAIARNYRPDHLALLPDQIGACSMKDGAGFIRNQLVLNAAKVEGISDESLGKVFAALGLVDNDMSFDAIREAVSTALRKRFMPNPAPDKGPYLWVESVYSNFTIYCYDGKLFRIGYTSSDEEGVTLSDAKPVEVMREVVYRTVGGAYTSNQDRNPQDESNMKKKLVDALIGNSGWTEEDRETLMAMDDKVLTKMGKAITDNKAATEAAIAAAKEEATKPTENKEEVETEVPIKATTPASKKKLMLNEYIDAMPSEFAAYTRNALAMQDKERTRLVGVITGNVRNTFTKERLMKMELNELDSLAQLAAPEQQEQPNAFYYGQAPVTDNADPADGWKPQPLGSPTLNFERKDGKKPVTK